ncbi:ZN574 protein, partial [Turnix velox]|nr:ZN574 protein [Turnix velox]
LLGGEEETLVVLEHRYVCSQCTHLSATLEDALLHQQQHHQQLQLVATGSTGLVDYQTLEVQESSQYQCLECGQLLLSPTQLLEHQEMHIKMLSAAGTQDGGGEGTPQNLPPPPPPHPPLTLKPAAGQIHYECLECKALFNSQEVWLAHRQTHRATTTTPSVATNPPQNQALVDLEHSYPKAEDEEGGGGGGGEEGGGDTVQFFLYECGECLQLFQTPKDFLEHQAAHLAAINGGVNEAPPPQAPPQPSDHSYELKDNPEE